MSQFVKAVCRTMERIAPLRLAEPWDNVGLLLEAPPVRNSESKVLLTIDLTPPVAREAITSGASMVIAYHPPIFKPLSSLTLANPLQRSLLQLAQEGISIYSPHTALDSVYGGINDWLAKAFVDDPRMGVNMTFLKDKNDPEGAAGRLLNLPHPGMSIPDIVAKVNSHLGIKHVQLTLPPDEDFRNNINTVAICAGSGGSMFEGVDADLYFTGEMQHHEVLAARAMGRFVVLCGHTNTERGYLEILKQKLLAERSTEQSLSGLDVQVSKEDRHPLMII